MRLSSALEIYRGRKVLVTGHTGFKGSWLSLWLASLGANVVGLSNAIPTEPSLFKTIDIDLKDDRRSDIRDLSTTRSIVDQTRPEIIFHLAAQPIVRTALTDPFNTIGVNVMGVAAILEAARSVPGVRGVVIVTSDKVYRDRPLPTAYREDDTLGGHEPYGSSKAAAEIISEIYTHANFHAGAQSRNIPSVITARAGNVIGGGDWAPYRLIPDTVNAILEQRDIVLRYPHSTRPWQHVLEPLGGYLLLGQRILAGLSAPRSVNFGPSDTPLPVMKLTEQFLSVWGSSNTKIVVEEDRSRVEAAMLAVDSSLAHETLGWHPTWNAERAVSETARWYREWAAGSAMTDICLQQIADYSLDAEQRSAAHAIAAA
ncbi:CDP-glucose 4,6-dehydratase [Variibacter gotjawalensis]|uniref:CDP-glucose 4,6-dehydratase n=1 Tax=Variibacter gotjawalensis TaxID=1333996 RepID=A0A0S3PZW8_9BRAD|nr:CDP-glucose 4,6-dehydratase [Variibacter gotjawalensis]NIK47334.1 CDP-glucose 4,6-dehydratase [Variibacter gotjawalensis]RZS49232.1 CDP-glucose 4,6-dehydratase [Variibacter gotjawalensis]BAT61494.1 CDP-glucose 4,6-dehydratase [Variibacter gotjawalensis]